MVPVSSCARPRASISRWTEASTSPTRGRPTAAVFAEPLDASAPRPSTPGVYWIKAGEEIPAAGALPLNVTTLALGPGVHRPTRDANGWAIVTLPSDVYVHLSLGAVLHAALRSEPAAGWGTQNISLGGYGVLSGEEHDREPHPDERHLHRGTPHAGCKGNTSPQGITLKGVAHAELRGITLVDHPNHHVIAGASAHCPGGAPSVARNLKILGWRANGDGLHVFSSWRVSDLFMRTQDDSMYTHTSNGPPNSGCPPPAFSRITTWNDANGASFIISGYGSTLSDADVLYSRVWWAWWGGGRVFSQRRMGSVSRVRVQRVRVHDPLPSLNAFQIDESDGPPGVGARELSAASTGRSFHDVTFADITIANLSTVRECPAFAVPCNCAPACAAGPLPAGVPNALRGGGNASTGNNITRLAFVNVSILGLGLRELGHAAPGWLNVSGGVVNVTVDGQPLQRV